jgi:hypothetical protein
MDDTQLIDHACIVAHISSSTYYEWAHDSLPGGQPPEILYFFNNPYVAIGPRHISPGYWSLDEYGHETSVHGSDWSKESTCEWSGSDWRGSTTLPNGMIIMCHK